MANIGPLTLVTGSTTRIELSAYTTPGSGWDSISASTGPITLGGSLKVLLTGGFTPSDSQSFLIMTNTLASGVTGSFGNLISGNYVYVYTNEATPYAGTFRVSQGTQNVILNSFSPPIVPKTKFVIR